MTKQVKIALGLVGVLAVLSVIALTVMKSGPGQGQGPGQIVKMAKDGVSESEMLAAVQQSSVHYSLSADDVIQLKESKVPDPVVIAMLNKKDSVAVASGSGGGGEGDLKPGSVIAPGK